MKKILFSICCIFMSLFCWSKDILKTYMDIYMTDGSVIQYENVNIDHVAFHTINLSDTIVCDSLYKTYQGNYNNESIWEQGLIWKGSMVNSEEGIRMTEYIHPDADYIILKNGYRGSLYVYENDKYIGMWNGDSLEAYSPYLIREVFSLESLKAIYPNCKFKLAIRTFTNKTPIQISEYENVCFFNKFYLNNVYSVEQNNAHPATLTFIDDDGYSEALKFWESIYNESGKFCTFALITNSIGNGKKVSWNDVDRLNKIGFECVSHTNGHINLTQKTEEEIRSDFSKSIELLKKHGCNSELVVYPGNKHNAFSDTLVNEYFKGGFWLGEISNNRPTKKTAINRYSILNTSLKINIVGNDGVEHSVYPLKSKEELYRIIDNAVLTGSWVVFMSHFRNEYNAGFYIDDDVKHRIIDLINYAQSKGVQIKTAGEAFKIFGE